MGKAPLQKIRITGLKSHYKILMQELHRKGVLHIVENEDFISHSTTAPEQYFTVFDLARIDFAIRFLEPYSPKTPFLDRLLTGGKIILTEAEAKQRLKEFAPHSEKIISECERVEYQKGQTEHEKTKIDQMIESIKRLKGMNMPLLPSFHTAHTKTLFALFPRSQQNELIRILAKESRLADVEFLPQSKTTGILRISYHPSVEEKIQAILGSYDKEILDFQKEWSEWQGKTPREILRQLERLKQEKEDRIQTLTIQQKELARYTDDLKILSDYNEWRKTKHDLQHKILKTKTVFAFEAWIAQSKYDEIQQWIQQAFVQEVSLEKIEPKEGEIEPTLVENKKGIAPFEFITEMFGIPDHQDLDPTPFLAPFFFVFFGLCLSDVGYGSLLAGGALIFLLTAKLSKLAKSGILLLFLCGISAILGGIVLGGYFGMTPEVLPQWLSQILITPEYLAGDTTAMPFKGQLINPMSGSGPIIFLVFTLVLGIFQLLVGLILSFVKNIKNKNYSEAFFDSLPWFFFISSIVFFSASSAIESIGTLKPIAQNMTLIGAGLLVATQGRHQKNWILKPIYGVLGLYNITGYLSDVLSYSRIMALGLATGVIGFAMNLTAGVLFQMMPHWILGIIVAVIIILFGHSLNFALSLLGAFVHSGRLQFIEFFGKFFDGNGIKFNPFQRQKKYIFFQEN